MTRRSWTLNRISQISSLFSLSLDPPVSVRIVFIIYCTSYRSSSLQSPIKTLCMAFLGHFFLPATTMQVSVAMAFQMIGHCLPTYIFLTLALRPLLLALSRLLSYAVRLVWVLLTHWTRCRQMDLAQLQSSRQQIFIVMLLDKFCLMLATSITIYKTETTSCARHLRLFVALFSCRVRLC